MQKKSEALMIADSLERGFSHAIQPAVKELRRLQEVNEELLTICQRMYNLSKKDGSDFPLRVIGALEDAIHKAQGKKNIWIK